MENMMILTYDDVRKIKNGKSDEGLVSVQSYDDSIVAQYEKFDMVAYAGLEILVRESVAKKLAAANERLRIKYNLSLKIVYGYRALEVQTNYYEKRKEELRVTNPQLAPEELRRLTHNFVAVPDVAGHVTGGAVDVTLVGSNGKECDMGTNIADYADEERIKTFAPEIGSDQQRFRRILFDEMTAVGFAPFLGEWWHFSYGDKEWAAYYRKPGALYGPVGMQKSATLFKIAGGNETALQIVRSDISAGTNSRAGKALLKISPAVEQAGLLNIEDKRLEMAGGEFCGNASAAAGVLLANQSGDDKVNYSASGFAGDVVAEVSRLNTREYRVRTSFNGMKCRVDKRGRFGVVDMGGIVHVLIEGDFPALNYESLQRELIDRLNLREREAVGVIWYERQGEKVQINPVVWVKKVNTLYYESSCGSGSIATALYTNVHDVVQPTGECINVEIQKDRIITECVAAVVT